MSKQEIYVGSLSVDTSEEDLKVQFSTCGDIIKVTLIKHQDTGISRGFGFIKFIDEKAIINALKLNGSVLNGHTIKVNVPNTKKW